MNDNNNFCIETKLELELLTVGMNETILYNSSLVWHGIMAISNPISSLLYCHFSFSTSVINFWFFHSTTKPVSERCGASEKQLNKFVRSVVMCRHVTHMTEIDDRCTRMFLILDEAWAMSVQLHTIKICHTCIGNSNTQTETDIISVFGKGIFRFYHLTHCQSQEMIMPLVFMESYYTG